jgi:two-component system sensor histidine kinase YesM
LYNADLAERRNYDYCSQTVASSILLMDHYIDQLRTISNVIANDRDIINAVNYRNSVSVIDYTIELYSQRRVADKIRQLDLLKIVTNAYIIGANYQSLYHYGMSPVVDFDFSAYEWFTSLRTSRDNAAMFTNFHDTEYILNRNTGQTVSLITMIRDSRRITGGSYAYLMCDFDLDSVLARNFGENQVYLAIYDGNDPIYFPDDHILSARQTQLFMSELVSGAGSFRILSRGGGESTWLVFTQQSNVSGWRIIGLTVMEDGQTPIVYYAAIMIVIAIAITIILAIILSKSVLRPLNRLVGKYRQIGEGHFDVTFEETGMGELEQLAETSQKMVENISQLNQSIIDEQQKLAKEQIKTLQHQINPHFLNNVLQSIKAMAVCGDVASIASITTLLGKMLSYSVYNPYEMVPLQKELEYVQNYSKIQNIRADGLISFEIECADTYHHIKIPKLMIQPIVENAFAHGFKTRTPLAVKVLVQASETNLNIQVSDDGAGMSQQNVDILNDKIARNESTDESDSIGLLNVNRRIINLYGDNSGLDIKKLDKGLMVTMHLPLNMVADQNT